MPRSKGNYYNSAVSPSLREALWAELASSFLSEYPRICWSSLCICLIEGRVLFEIKGLWDLGPSTSLLAMPPTHTHSSAHPGQWQGAGRWPKPLLQAAGCTWLWLCPPPCVMTAPLTAGAALDRTSCSWLTSLKTGTREVIAILLPGSAAQYSGDLPENSLANRDPGWVRTRPQMPVNVQPDSSFPQPGQRRRSAGAR